MFVDLILPVSVPNLYTYGVPIELQPEMEIGKRVEVEFGKRKRYSAIIASIHNTKPDVYEPKAVLSVLDSQPIVTANQINFWNWMSDYYMANIGDVMNAALPSALNLNSETKIQLIFEGNVDELELNDDEFLLMEALSHKNELSIKEVQTILNKQQVFPALQELIDQRVIKIKEQLKQNYKQKTEQYIRLSEQYQSDEQMHHIIDLLSNAPKQQDAFLRFLSITKQKPIWIQKKVWTDAPNVTTSAVRALVQKQFFDIEDRPIQGKTTEELGDFSSQLSDEQQQAYTQIVEAFEVRKTVLLHGVTGSGKTHIYIKLIEEAIQEGKQVLYLLPEIALTSQIISRLEQHFGNQISVYHSRHNDHQRVSAWKSTLSNESKIIVGARSALFLPFQNLGLILIDEEHDTSFKQRDPAPRYHARDAALWLAMNSSANCLMGTATPSFESYFNATNNKYCLVELSNRFGESSMPEIEIVNLNKQHIPGKTYNTYSKRLIDELDRTVQAGKQAILFRNRRGYSSIMQCTACGNAVKCVNCDVSLTYHKFRYKLECHYCGYKEDPPYRCPACGHNELEFFGLGTQRIEEELQAFLPKAKIARMDLDTTRGKNSHQKIIEQFERQEIDILVGTQMVTKGLDFDHVSLVGILNADSILKFPDFRAEEHAFQLFEQVSGRAGRKKDKGLVLVQVRSNQNPLLHYLKNHDYIGFYEQKLPERWQFRYPPYYRQINVTCKHKDWKTCYQAALMLSQQLRKKGNQIIRGPSEPLVSRVNNWYLQEVLITIEKRKEYIQSSKEFLQQSIDFVHQQKGFSTVRINVDVDPQ